MKADGREHGGFAKMSPERRSQIARLGGIAAHQKGTAHEWTSAEAKAASDKSAESRRRKSETDS